MTARIGSLCSGAGGLDLAVEAVFGAETVWHCEIDDAASKVLAHRWPGVPNHRDLISTDWTAVEPIDVLCAGWPCQPFSLAGKRKGADDERAIWPHIAGAVRGLRPRIVVLENVTAVLAVEFGRVADSLAALGYDLRWTSLRASDVGAPHRRERLFVVASDTTGERWAGRDESQPDVVSDGPQSAHVRSLGAVADAARDGWDEGWPESARLIGGSDAAISGDGPLELLPTPRNSDGERGPSNKVGGLRPSGQKRSVDLATVTRLEQRWGKYEAATRRWENLTRPAPSPTEPNKNGNPRLSAAFSEWLMGWPAGWVTEVLDISRNDQLRIIGNGVVPQQAIAALRWLVNVSERAA